MKLKFAYIEDDIADLSDNDLEVNTDDTDHQMIDENTNDTDPNVFNDYIELRYFPSDVELLQQEDNVGLNQIEEEEDASYLVYLNDANSAAVTLNYCHFTFPVLVLFYIFST